MDVILSIFVEKTFDQSKKPNISEVFWGTQKDQALESKHNKQIRSNSSEVLLTVSTFALLKSNEKSSRHHKWNPEISTERDS